MRLGAVRSQQSSSSADYEVVGSRALHKQKPSRRAPQFDAGSPGAARARGLSPETAAAVRKWLDENDDSKMPGMKK